MCLSCVDGGLCLGWESVPMTIVRDVGGANGGEEKVWVAPSVSKMVAAVGGSGSTLDGACVMLVGQGTAGAIATTPE